MSGWFNLGGAPQADSLVLLSDLHIDEMASDKLDRLVGFLRQLPAQTPLVILGDLASGLHKAETRRRLERDAAALLATLARFRGPDSAASLYIPGNHDSHFRKLPMDWKALPLTCVGGRTPVYVKVHGRTIRLSHGDEYDPGTPLYRYTSFNHHNRMVLGMFELERRWWRGVGRWSRALEQRVRGHEYIDWLARISETPVPRPVFFLLGWELAARRLLEREPIDAVVMGHTHAPRLVRHKHGCYVNTGDWLQHAVVTWIDRGGVHQQDLSNAAELQTISW